ncbi:nucleotidyltransferase [Sporolactobacillus kofuensis]|uniref:tRNA(Met) cytidine acetate ligase n=1 Tax=Sporolactobacillus kofuensis TaxID=269672 RepID=A0ABW1WEP7_9BACL|nr:nucleotidyltransferase [Sporolactobacillus kofuensis]MCO7174605.1 nucleotidyltransferase [Sporolactobacillus kofuensis]
MIIAGIIAEYNPFHNGHLYQLNRLRETLHPDLVVVVMSGDFLQRGEPALVSKWTRTKMALQSGIDLIVELPFVYAVGKADTFARGAVALLDQLGVTHLFFSSECGQIEPFQNTLSLIQGHQDIYSMQLAHAMSQGLSYPNAHAAAYRFIAKNDPRELVDLAQPNNSLGFHYLKAIEQRNSAMIPLTMKRYETEHNDRTFEKDASVASASSIRRHLLEGAALQAIKNKIPHATCTALKNAQETYGYASWERFFPFLKYKLLSMNTDRLSEIYEIEEGIEFRLLACIRSAHSFHDFITSVKTKRYTWARLQRLAVHILTDTLKSEAKPLALNQEPDSIRLLGMNRDGQAYLALIRKKMEIPILSKIRNHRSKMLEQDIKAAQIYDYLVALGHTSHPFTETGHPPVRYDAHQKSFLGDSD